jgi:hypothetical protein
MIFRFPTLGALVFLLAGLFAGPVSLKAHHEAIFGPQSSLVLSADKFLSLQVFSRELGTFEAKTRETTALVSVGLRLSKQRPLTFTAILPYSWISERDKAGISGAEDILVGLRYRHDLKGLQEKWDREGNFLMGMGAFELNNGSIDHRAWRGPVDSMGAVLGSLEWGKWSAIGYTVARFNVEDSEGNKDGNNVFLGGGLAFTPNEDFQTGRLISYQAGWSFEHYSRHRIAGRPAHNTGGEEFLLHPTVVYSPGHRLLFFGIVSVPLWRDFQDPAQQDAYRFGTGVVYAW